MDSDCLSDDLEANEVIQVVQNKAPDKTLELWSTLSTNFGTQTHSTESEAWGHVPSYYLNHDAVLHIGDDEYDNYDGSSGGTSCGCILF